MRLVGDARARGVLESTILITKRVHELDNVSQLSEKSGSGRSEKEMVDGEDQ